ncbi:MAG: hypothetical protein P8J33_16170, partial [Pirellulaceae bacterium]|nr:hypothetical protein [Pirellulaceae bacterium]
ASLSEGNPEISQFECSVFDGKYVAGDVDQEYLAMLENRRNDQARSEESQRNLFDTDFAIGLNNENS